MADFAQRLMTLHRGGQADTGQNSAIFGSVGIMGQNLETRERIRIAMWPIICQTNPAIGMGLSIALAHRLEQYDGVRVYRMFTRAAGDGAASYDWRAGYNDLTIDDWQLDRLDDNVSLWGELVQENDLYKLQIEFETDLSEEDESVEQTLEAKSLPELLIAMVTIANGIAENLEIEAPSASVYDTCKASDEQINQLFEMLIDWQVNLQLVLWDHQWDVHKALELLQKLVTLAIEIDDPFAAWTAGNIIAHGMEPGYGDFAEAFADVSPDMPEQFTHSRLATPMVARALYHLGRTEAAFDLLEAETERSPAAAEIWILLGVLYQLGGRLFDGLETYQRAIEQEITSKELYLQYVGLIQGFYQNQLTFDEFVLIDPDEYGEVSDTHLMGWEAVKAYEAVLLLDLKDNAILYLLVLQLLALDATDEFWQVFERFVKAEPEANQLQTIIGEMDQLEDITPAIEILEKLTKPNDAPVDLMLALASLYTLEEENDLAMDLLERAETMTEDPGVLAEIDHLFLAAEDPEFDVRLGDIDALVQSGNQLSSDDFEFLEDVLERAPAMIELYIILGRAYEAAGDVDAALETLLDGHEQSKDDPDLLSALGSLLWETGQEELAFEYLNRGIAANPNHVPLLATTGQYLFENGQDDKARAYLARAERIAPRHPALATARRAVAELLSQRNA